MKKEILTHRISVPLSKTERETIEKLQNIMGDPGIGLYLTLAGVARCALDIGLEELSKKYARQIAKAKKNG